MGTLKRRSGLPKSLTGQKYRYDKYTVVVPREIYPRSPQWQKVPGNQRHTRNYRLLYLPSQVKGRYIYTHELLDYLLRNRERA